MHTQHLLQHLLQHPWWMKRPNVPAWTGPDTTVRAARPSKPAQRRFFMEEASVSSEAHSTATVLMAAARPFDQRKSTRRVRTARAKLRNSGEKSSKGKPQDAKRTHRVGDRLVCRKKLENSIVPIEKTSVWTGLNRKTGRDFETED